MPKTLAVGIDLGTTYSAAAWIDQRGRSELLADSQGDLLTPSVVLFDDYQIGVGKAARKSGVIRPDRFADIVKRDMGNPYYSKAIDNEYLPPEIIQSYVLKYLAHGIESQIGRDFGVVITVPAFFDEPRRRATAIAAKIAGLNLLDIVNEPVAAALAFGEHLNAMRPGEVEKEPLHVVAFDLGGGTFDVSLLKISERGFRTIATDGDVHLGGHDWDNRLCDYVCDAFVKKYRENPRDNPVSRQRLMVEIENAKHTLSVRKKATIRIDHAGTNLEASITRETFEEITASLLERTAHTTTHLLRTANLDWDDVSRVLLVGGSTRMPMIESMLRERTGIVPDSMVNPDEAVARGAAIYAKYLLDTQGPTPPNFKITHVNSHSLGIQGIERDTRNRVNAILIPRNMPLPASAKRVFGIKEQGQTEIAILVLEGESALPRECTVIGRTKVTNLPSDLPAGHPVEVQYEYQTNGTLRVNARVIDVDCDLTIEIERGARLPEELISEWKEIVTGEVGWLGLKRSLKEYHARNQPTEQNGKVEDGATGRAKKRQLEFDEVVVPEANNNSHHPEEQKLDLEPTVTLVDEGDASDDMLSSAYGSIESVYSPAPVDSHGTRRKMSFPVEILKAMSAGPPAFVIVVAILWWGLDRDPFKIAPKIPKRFEFIVPESLRPPIPVVHREGRGVGANDTDIRQGKHADPPGQIEASEAIENKKVVSVPEENVPPEPSRNAPLVETPDAPPVSPKEAVRSAMEDRFLTTDLDKIRTLLRERRIGEAQQHLAKTWTNFQTTNANLQAYDFLLKMNLWLWQDFEKALFHRGEDSDISFQDGTEAFRVIELSRQQVTIFYVRKRKAYNLRTWETVEDPTPNSQRTSVSGIVCDGMPSVFVEAIFDTLEFSDPGYPLALKAAFLAAEGEYDRARSQFEESKTKLTGNGITADDIDLILRYLPSNSESTNENA